MIEALTQNIVSNIVWLAIGGVGLYVFEQFRSSAWLKYWLFSSISGEKYFVIGVPFYFDTKQQSISYKSGLPLIGIGPLKSIVKLLTMQIYFSRFKGKVLIDDDVSADHLKNDMCLIGYPDGNSLSETIWNIREMYFKFDGHRIFTDDGEIDVFPSYDGVGNVVKDFGLITLIRNPFCSDKRIAIFSGSETYGVQVAIDYVEESCPIDFFGWMLVGPLARILTLLKMLFRMRSPDQFEILVEADVHNGNIGGMKLRAYAKDRKVTLIREGV